MVQGRHISEIMQLGKDSNSSSHFSSGFCSMLHAAKNCSNKLREGRASKFSHPSGNPASWPGKRSETNSMLRFEAFASSRTVLNRAALRGVKIMVTFTPWCASSLAISVNGMRWLWDIKGTRRK